METLKIADYENVTANDADTKRLEKLSKQLAKHARKILKLHNLDVGGSGNRITLWSIFDDDLQEADREWSDFTNSRVGINYLKAFQTQAMTDAERADYVPQVSNLVNGVAALGVMLDAFTEGRAEGVYLEQVNRHTAKIVCE